MKRVILATILFVNGLSAQVNTFTSKFFFDLPFHATMFDIRSKIQGNNNFYGFSEYSNSISADFKYHPNITNLPAKHREPHIQISFDDKGLSDTKSITLDYDASEVNECMAVYEQIIKIFKPYTRKTAPSAKKDIELTGKGIQIFPLAGAKYYMIDLNCEYNENAKRYQLNILMFENNWWK